MSSGAFTLVLLVRLMRKSHRCPPRYSCSRRTAPTIIYERYMDGASQRVTRPAFVAAFGGVRNPNPPHVAERGVRRANAGVRCCYVFCYCEHYGLPLKTTNHFELIVTWVGHI